VLRLAKEYGRSPEEVENWDPYWFNRANTWLEGEAIADQQEQEARKRSKK
jgi:hypothetical protein